MTTDGPVAGYRALLEAGTLKPDAAQTRASERLERLHRALDSYRPAVVPAASLSRWIARRWAPAAPSVPPPRGLYIWGDVGRGKSMLMDLFFASAPVERKRRVHFHAFMQEVHHRLHALRDRPIKDPLSAVATEIADAAWLLCFDEFHVTDIADAMLLGRLFDALFAAGVVIVATSNRAPDRLYEGGLHRERFLPFIATLRAHLDVIELDFGRDYRLSQVAGRPVYYTPLGDAARVALEDWFAVLRGDQPATALVIEVKKRAVNVPRAAGRAAWFGFADLCGKPLGAVDYLALAERFDDVILADVPRLNPDRRDEARRFNTLIDILYEAKTRLIMSAEAPAAELYTAGDGAFEFARTVSRLVEMQSAAYLASRDDAAPVTLAQRAEGLQGGALAASGVSR